MQKRVENLDLLKGMVMVLMALDHIRDFFHLPAFLYDPSSLELTSLPIYFTRFITHFCAPVFAFLAGISVFLMARKKEKSALSVFLLKRGFWLILLDITVISFGWYFNFNMNNPILGVIWVLGAGMILLAGLIHFKEWVIWIFSLSLIFLHNLSDGKNLGSIWHFLHSPGSYETQFGLEIILLYPIIPWVAIMALGYVFGIFYNSTYPSEKRRQTFLAIGIASILLFMLLRSFNLYGDRLDFKLFDSNWKFSLMSFFNLSKYPPSLQYVLITLGPALIFLAVSENFKGWWVKFFSTFGRVPFFYYILHLYVIHIAAIFAAKITGYGWQAMIFEDWGVSLVDTTGYGFNLITVYLVWIALIMLLYPICRWYDNYKRTHQQYWWLSYL